MRGKIKFIGLGPRILAFLIDLGLFAVFVKSADELLEMYCGQNPLILFFFYLAIPFMFIMYNVMFHAIWGQTLGKMILKIKLYTTQFEDLDLKHAVLRDAIAISLQLMSIIGILIALQQLPSYFVSPDMLKWPSTYVVQIFAAAQQRNPLSSFLSISYAVWMLAIFLPLSETATSVRSMIKSLARLWSKSTTRFGTNAFINLNSLLLTTQESLGNPNDVSQNILRTGRLLCEAHIGVFIGASKSKDQAAIEKKKIVIVNACQAKHFHAGQICSKAFLAEVERLADGEPLDEQKIAIMKSEMQPRLLKCLDRSNDQTRVDIRLLSQQVLAGEDISIRSTVPDPRPES